MGENPTQQQSSAIKRIITLPYKLLPHQIAIFI